MRRMLPVDPLPLVLLFVTLSGCGSREPIATVRKLIDTEFRLAKNLESVHDAQSAMAVVSEIESDFQRMSRLMLQLPELERKYKGRKFRKTTLEKLQRDRVQAEKEFHQQAERIKNLRGLPVEFWRVVRVAGIELACDAARAMQASGMFDPQVTQDAQRFTQEFLSLLKQHGHDQTILVEFTNLPDELQDEAIEKMRAAAPGATTVHFAFQGIVDVSIGPVEDYQTFIKSLDLGQIIFQDEPQRRAEIRVDRRKLGARANSDEEEDRLAEAERQREWAEREKARQEEQRRREEEQRRREAERRGPDRSDPEYFEKMRERISSDDRSIRSKAIDVFLEVHPAEIESVETRKEVARTFRKLAFEGSHQEQAKAIKGLVAWAGKYSTPVLVELLESGKLSVWNRSLMFETLGDLQDPRAAKPVAKRLSKPGDAKEAAKCLRRLGPLAEDAIIEIVPTLSGWYQPKAIALLGECGTKKSLRHLREAQKHRDRRIREAAKRAAAEIRQRESAKKSD